MEQEGVSLSAIALSLSAFLTSSSRLDNEQLWVEMCSSLKTKLQDPYLKAIFAFLSVMNTGLDYNYADIIVSFTMRQSFIFFMLLFFFRTILTWILPIDWPLPVFSFPTNL